MTDPLEQFANLAAQARGSAPPPIDVTDRVLSDLRTIRPRQTGDALLWTLGGVAVLAASITILLGYGSYDTLTDPLAGLLEPLSMVLQ
ncbi:MAG: hypothetical protein K8T91_19030 [Planctomycetes bacterium]|nr:hypothetical protein [Planctomycetota bacterium]